MTSPTTQSRSTLGWSLIALLVAVSAIGPLAINGVLPATTTVMAEFEQTYGTAQLVLTVFMAAMLVAQVVVGQAADSLGRRPVMIACLAIFSVGSVMCALAPDMTTLLIARVVQGVGAAACMVLPRTIVRDVYGRDEAASVIGYMTTAMMIAPLFGPAAGGWITTHYDWRLMYVGLAVAGAALTVIAAVMQRETRVATQPDETVSNNTGFSGIRQLLADPHFVVIAVLMAGSVGIYYSFLAGAPGVAMQSREMAPQDYGLWFAMVGIGYLCGNLVAGRFSSRIGAMRMIEWGLLPLGLGVIAMWALSGSTHPIALFLPMQLVAFSNGMSIPNLMSVIMSVKPELSGTASGLAGTMQIGVGILLTIAVGFLLPYSDLWLFVLMSLCGLVAAVCIAWSRQQRISAVPR